MKKTKTEIELVKLSEVVTRLADGVSKLRDDQAKLEERNKAAIALLRVDVTRLQREVQVGVKDNGKFSGVLNRLASLEDTKRTRTDVVQQELVSKLMWTSGEYDRAGVAELCEQLTPSSEEAFIDTMIKLYSALNLHSFGAGVGDKPPAFVTFSSDMWPVLYYQGNSTHKDAMAERTFVDVINKYFGKTIGCAFNDTDNTVIVYTK